MEGTRFDRWTRSLLAQPPSRRALLAGLISGIVAPHTTAAACPPRRRCAGQCCAQGKVCRAGVCSRCRNADDCQRQYGLTRPACVDGFCRECGAIDGGASGDEICEALHPNAPFCVDNECRQCRAGVEGDCPAGKRCDEQGFCRADWCVNDRFDPTLGETDKNCGGTCPTKCAFGQGCRRDTDCAVGRLCRSDGDPSRTVCIDCKVNTHCPAARPFCTAERRCVQCRQDGDCSVGQRCQSNDCIGGGGPSCNNEVRDGDETDKDCGGGTCPKCGILKRCKEDTDCRTGHCGFVDLNDGNGLRRICAECFRDEHCPGDQVCSRPFCDD